MIRNLAIAAAFGVAAAAIPAQAAEFVLINTDVAGIGFNDPTPATPVGGNTGTTLGAQRLIAYQRALDLWGSVLASDVPIRVQGSFARLNCTATGDRRHAGLGRCVDHFLGFSERPAGRSLVRRSTRQRDCR